ncbi:hypothetical protein ACFLVM_01800 [Chloroflexota bacterium]
MVTGELLLIYQNKSNLELLLTAENYDNGYTDDAINTALLVLLSRFKDTTNIEQIREKEMARLSELAELCSICHNSDVVDTSDFYVCSEGRTDVVKSIPGLVALAIVGFGYTKEKYNAVELEFRLCPQCLNDRSKYKKQGTKVIISWEDYHVHPLYAFYMLQGFTEIRPKVSTQLEVL